MYDWLTTAELNDQLAAQARLVGYLAERLGIEPADVAHTALLPAQLAAELGTPSLTVVTWEQLMKAYADVAPPYLLEMLRVAFVRYEELAAQRTTFGANAESKLTGAQICERHRADSLTPSG